MTATDTAAFTPPIKTAVLSAFGLEPELRLLSDWHAFTFEAVREGRICILRLTPQSHQPPEAIAAELEWQSFVGRSGLVRVPEIFVSNAGNQVEVFDAPPTKFTAVLFEKLDGRPVATADWNESLFEKWGQLVGTLHALSQAFQPAIRRSPWHESQFLDVARYIPDSEPIIKANALAVIAEIKALPRDSRTFGIIHGDVYQDNFFIGPSGLQLFDFDLAEYGYYISDIAVALYAALWRLAAGGESREAFAARFLQAFRQGYATKFELPADEWALLPLFLKLREILIYIVARKKRDLANMSPVGKALLEERGARIANGNSIGRFEK